MKEYIKKIALIGPESSGKTTLAMQLAAHFQTAWVPEFSRGYIMGLNRKYTLEDIEHCTREQLRSETQKLAGAQRFLFCDSEMIIAKVWCEDVFKTTPAWMDELVRVHTYDLYLLTRPDIPFKEDPVRENPERRDYFYDWYKRELEKKNSDYEIISGEGSRRFSNSLAAIEKHFPASLKHIAE